jgi:hypothetical protein
MDATQPKNLVWENVCKLMGGSKPPSLDDVVTRTKVPRGNLQRIRDGNQRVAFENILKLAAAFKIEPWQLLFDGLDPNNPPDVNAAPERWPFKQIDRGTLLGLRGTQAAAVEAGILVAMASAGVESGKRNGTHG